MNSAELRKEWISKWSRFVKEITAGTGIFPDVVFTIALIESSAPDASGTWRPANSWLAKNAYNLFGIKKGRGWSGKTVARSDDKPNELFRVYASQNDSFKDFVSFLQNNSRYKNAGVFDATTPAEQLKAIASAGYSTTPTYADNAIKILNGIAAYIPGSSASGTTATKQAAGGSFIFMALAAAGLLLMNFKGGKK